MRASFSRQCAPTVSNCSSSSVAVAPARQSQRRMQAAIRSSLAHTTPAQFSSFHGAKMFLPQLFVSSRRPAVAGKKPAQMSFLGVGAPEALLVGVVALVVFGPKGLAEAAKSVGKTLRAFQPTIREVVDASQDIRGTLEQELGLNELREATRPPPPAPRPPSPPVEDVDEDIEAKRKASAAAAWGMSAQQQQQQAAAGQQPPDAAAATPAAATTTAPPSTSGGSSSSGDMAGGSGNGNTGSSLSSLSASMANGGASGPVSGSSSNGSSSSSLSPGSSSASTSSPPPSVGAPSPAAAPTAAPAASGAGQGAPQATSPSSAGLGSMSIEELEAELARRRQSSS